MLIVISSATKARNLTNWTDMTEVNNSVYRVYDNVHEHTCLLLAVTEQRTFFRFVLKTFMLCHTGTLCLETLDTLDYH